MKGKRIKAQEKSRQEEAIVKKKNCSKKSWEELRPDKALLERGGGGGRFRDRTLSRPKGSGSGYNIALPEISFVL